MSCLPATAQKAAVLADLERFLENVEIGFHWDILDRLEDGIYILDRERRIVYWSAGAERITGYRAEEVLGRSCADNLLKHVDETGRTLCTDGCPMLTAIVTGQPQAADVYLHHKAGHRVPVRIYGAPICDAEGVTIGAFETFSETTSLLAPLERVRQLEQIAYIDVLTGVANRRFLEREIDRRFSELRRDGWGFGVVLADVDHFKQFNDRHGHATGDRVLSMVAATLARSCRPYDLVGRWGGEEFLMIVSHSELVDLRTVGERARALVAASSLDLDGCPLQVTISAGATIAHPADDLAGLIERADALLYRSKAFGRNRVTVAADSAPAWSAVGRG